MKAHLAIAALACSLVLGGSSVASAQLGGALRGLGQKAVDKANEKKNTPDPAPAPEPAKPEPKPEPAPAQVAQKDPAPATAAAAAPAYKAYQNYDFVPGDKIVFDD